MSGFMRQLLARASGEGGGPRVRPAAAPGGLVTDRDGLDVRLVASAIGAAERISPVEQPPVEQPRPGAAPVASRSAPPPLLQRPPPATSRSIEAATPAEPGSAAATPPRAVPGPVTRDDEARVAPLTPSLRAPTVLPAAPATQPPAALQPPRPGPDAAASRPAPWQAPPSIRPAPYDPTRATPASGRSAVEPVVHVSIGRVELTALVAVPAARPKAPARHATTSLADYLRGSGHGARK